MPALLVALASILLAHGDTGRLELLETTAVDDTTVTYVVELTYEGDGDPVSNAEVVVTAAGAPPQTMDPQGEGRYEATVELPGPGEHEVRFAVEEPAAELVVAQVVDEPATTTTSDPTTSTTAERTRDEVAEESGSAWWLLIVMGAFAAAMVVVAVAFFRGRASASSRPSR